MNLGENIYRFRTEKNMSQSDLAEALGVSRQSVSKWENNSAVPELDKLMKVSKLFGITLDELVSGETAPNSPATEPAVQVNSSSLSRRKLLGIVFLVCGGLIILAFLLNGEGAGGILPAVPVLCAGALCFSEVRHLGLWCAWVLCMPLVFTNFTDHIRYDISRWMTPALYLSLLCLTLWDLRDLTVPQNKRTATLLILGYGAWFAFLANWVYTELCIRESMAQGIILTHPHWQSALAFLLLTALITVTWRLLKQK